MGGRFDECPWEALVQLYWTKYRQVPNDQTDDVVSTTFNEVSYNPEKLMTSYTRIAMVELKAPSFLKKLAGIFVCFVLVYDL